MSSLKVELLPIFDDNYVFFIIDTASSECLIVDPGDAEPVLDFLSKHQLKPRALLLTHHHTDHVGGVEDILKAHPIPVYASVVDSRKMAFPVTTVEAQSELQLGVFKFKVLSLPGHTLGHIAFYEKNNHWLFSGDVLFGLGCGRVFEGTYDEMFLSLQTLKALPDQTLVFCTHEYTETNLLFCKKLSPLDQLPLVGDDEELEIYENQLRNRRSLQMPSVPLKLAFEKRVNPFLLAQTSQIFTRLRELRNKA